MNSLAVKRCLVGLRADLLVRRLSRPGTEPVPLDLESLLLAGMHFHDDDAKTRAVARALLLAAEAVLDMSDARQKRAEALAKTRDLADQTRTWSVLVEPLVEQSRKRSMVLGPDAANFPELSLPVMFDQLCPVAPVLDDFASLLERQLYQPALLKKRGGGRGRPDEELLSSITRELRDDGRFTFRAIATITEGRATKQAIERVRQRYKALRPKK